VLYAAEKASFDQMDVLYKKGAGYAGMMVTRPQTLGYSLADSPAGLAAWFYDKFASSAGWTNVRRSISPPEVAGRTGKDSQE